MGQRRQLLLAQALKPPPPPTPGVLGSLLELSPLECEQGRWAGYLGRSRLTNLTVEFLGKPQGLLSAAGGRAAEAGRPVLMDSPGDGPIRAGRASPPTGSACVGGKNHFSYSALSWGLAPRPDRPICLRLTDGGEGGGRG